MFDLASDVKSKFPLADVIEMLPARPFILLYLSRSLFASVSSRFSVFTFRKSMLSVARIQPRICTAANFIHLSVSRIAGKQYRQRNPDLWIGFMIARL